MAKASGGRSVKIFIDGDYSKFQDALNAVKKEAKGSGAAIAEAMRGGVSYQQASRQIQALGTSLTNMRASAQAVGADFQKAEGQLKAMAKAAGLSEEQFAGLARQMAQKTNLNNLEKNLNQIQRLTGASALQMARLRAEAGDTAGAIRGLGQAASDGLGKIVNLKNAIMVVVTGMAFREFAKITSVMTDLDSRLKLATGSADEAAAAFARIHEVANRTYASLESTAEIFLANSTAFNDLGYSAQQQLDLMEALTNAMVVSGAKGQRAEAVINALAKAMISGELKGRNFNSVLQMGGRATQALADGLGVSIRQLKEMSEAGMLTTERVFKALTSQLEALRAEADAMPATINDAFVKLRNNYMVVVKAIDDASEASRIFVRAIDFVGESLVRMAAAGDVSFTILRTTFNLIGLGIESIARSIYAVIRAGYELQTSLPTPANLKRIYGELGSYFKDIGQTIKKAGREMDQDVMDSANRMYEAAGKAKEGAEIAAASAANSVGPANQAADAFRDLAAAMSLVGGAGNKVGTSLEANVNFMLERTRQARSALKETERINKSYERYAMAHIAIEIDQLSKRNDLTRAQQDELLQLQDTYKKLRIYQAEVERGETGIENARKRGGGSAAKAAREAERALKDQYKAGQLILELEKEYAQLTGHTREAQIKEIEKQADKWRYLAEKIKDAEEKAQAFALIQDIVAEKMRRVSGEAIDGLIEAMDRYIEANTAAAKAGEMFNRTADAMTNAFTDIIMGNKSVGESFCDMAKIIVAELARIAVQMLVIMPIVQAFRNMLGGFMGGFGGGSANVSLPGTGISAGFVGGGADIRPPGFAKGGVFNSPSLSAFSNEVHASPQMFSFAKGIGQFAEAGPEAIMPLSRDSRGRLGVSVADGYDSSPNVQVVNNIKLINQTGTPVKAEMQQKRAPGGGWDTEVIIKSLEDTMSNRIKTGQSGLAPTMESLYGISSVRQRRLRSG